MHDLFSAEAHLDALMHQVVAASTAEVALLTTHRRGEGYRATRWDDISSRRYALTARTHALQLIDVRTAWKAYLADHGLAPKALLRDSAGHLNDAGNALMAQIVEHELVLVPTSTPADRGISELPPPSFDAHGRASFGFDGTRLVAVVKGDIGNAPIAVSIDGAAPSAHPRAWLHGRVGGPDCADWPWDCAAVLRVDNDRPLLDEEWTLSLSDVAPDGTSFSFSVRGDRTGEDGVGRSDQDFVSTSGRVRIAARDWFLRRVAAQARRAFPTTFSIRWRPTLMGSDLIAPSSAPHSVVLIGGLENRRHTVTLEQRGTGSLPKITFVAHKPPL
jgi:hypothetical protein